jgi:hypothetical protein
MEFSNVNIKIQENSRIEKHSVNLDQYEEENTKK